MQPPDFDPAAAVEDALLKYLRHESGQGGRTSRPDYVYASGWRKCARAMCLDLTHPEMEQFSDDSLARMKNGKDVERNVRAELEVAGGMSNPPFEVQGAQQRFEIKDENDRVIIVGKIDGFLVWPSLRVREPFEVKAGESIRRIQALADFENSPWTRPMPRQLLAYVDATGATGGIFVLKRPGLPKILRVPMDDRGRAMVEEFKAKARTAVDYKQGKGNLPGFIDDPSECKRCAHYGSNCAPPFLARESLTVLDDPQLIDLAQTVVENDEARLACDRARKKLSEAVRGRELVHLGNRFEVTGHWKPRTSYGVPDDVKAPYQQTEEQGSWAMSIEPLTAVGEEA